MKVVTVIQARCTSSRLPNKVLLDMYGKPLLERVINQAQKIQHSDEVWVATSTHETDDLIEVFCNRLNVSCFRGSLSDVRGRFYDIATSGNADIVVRITADNPLTEPEYADDLIQFLKMNPGCDYARIDKSAILNGTQSEVFSAGALRTSVDLHNDNENREHVTPAMITKMNMQEIIPTNKELIAQKPYFVGVDTFADYKRSILLFEKFGTKQTLKQIIKQINTYGTEF
jgi:spore coat polysaccharide biosynthesis protein SpsF